MSSNIRIQRICQFCNNEFTAKTTVTKYCSDNCAKKAYKQRKKIEKINASNKETQKIITLPIEQLKAKEYLTVREVSKLLSCSIRTVYYYIESGNIKAVNLGQRMTRIKRSALDDIFK
jgi:excisionase family DNA binding protein